MHLFYKYRRYVVWFKIHSNIVNFHTPKPGFPGVSAVKNPHANSGGLGLFLCLGQSSVIGNGNLLQYSCLGNPMDRGVWQDTVHAGSQKSQLGCNNQACTQAPCFPCKSLCPHALQFNNIGCSQVNYEVSIVFSENFCLTYKNEPLSNFPRVSQSVQEGSQLSILAYPGFVAV